MNRCVQLLLLGLFCFLGSAQLAHAQRLDRETGLLYCKNRYYSPDLGRFIGRDPIGYEGGLNLYYYVENKPTVFVDSLGLKKKCCVKRFDVYKAFGLNESWRAEVGDPKWWDEKNVIERRQKFFMEADFIEGPTYLSLGCATYKIADCACECCEYRQFVKRDGKSGEDTLPPDKGSVHTWAYGHRDTSKYRVWGEKVSTENMFYDDPDREVINVKSGCYYRGKDLAGIAFVPPGDAQRYNAEFTGQIIDVCNGNKVVREKKWRVDLSVRWRKAGDFIADAIQGLMTSGE